MSDDNNMKDTVEEESTYAEAQAETFSGQEDVSHMKDAQCPTDIHTNESSAVATILEAVPLYLYDGEPIVVPVPETGATAADGRSSITRTTGKDNAGSGNVGVAPVVSFANRNDFDKAGIVLGALSAFFGIVWIGLSAAAIHGIVNNYDYYYSTRFDNILLSGWVFGPLSALLTIFATPFHFRAFQVYYNDGKRRINGTEDYPSSNNAASPPCEASVVARKNRSLCIVSWVFYGLMIAFGILGNGFMFEPIIGLSFAVFYMAFWAIQWSCMFVYSNRMYYYVLRMASSSSTLSNDRSASVAEPSITNTVQCCGTTRSINCVVGTSLGASFLSIVIIVAVVVVSLVVVSTRTHYYHGDDDYWYPPEYWITAPETRFAYYGVNATIDRRLMRTMITVEVHNDQNCTLRNGVTIQLPVNARVTSLQTRDNNGCILNGDIQSEQRATKTFEDLSSQGKAVAMVQAYDISNYHISLSVPPRGGTTRLELIIEELLQLRRNRVEFQIPFAPPVTAERMEVELHILDEGEVQKSVAFNDSNGTGINALLRPGMFSDDDSLVAHFIGTNVTTKSTQDSYDYGDNYDREDTDELVPPSTIRGYFIPKRSFEYNSANGTLMIAGECFEHIFNPSSLVEAVDALPRFFVFVLDVSGSMEGNKLEDAKAAFSFMIESLSQDDVLAVHIFADKGTEDVWGPVPATDAAKEQAMNYVYQLYTRGATNLNDAYLDALDRVQDYITSEGNAVDTTRMIPIIVLMTDGQPTEGVGDPVQIARNVVEANDRRVKMYSLAFGDDAAMDLLLSVAIQNDGLAHKIFDGFGDSKEQMQIFFDSELRTILFSDIRVNITGPTGLTITDVSQPYSPILPAGSEVVVRGLLETTNVSSRALSGLMQATTTAISKEGTKSWAVKQNISTYTGQNDESNKKSRCYQSYAHSRVAELMRYREAALLLGDELKEYIHLGEGIKCYGSLVACIEREALTLALQSGLVWPGLTALVTVEDGSTCSANFDDQPEVCYDGTYPTAYGEVDESYAEGGGSSYSNRAPSYGADWGGGSMSTASTSASFHSFSISWGAFFLSLSAILYIWLP